MITHGFITSKVDWTPPSKADVPVMVAEIEYDHDHVLTLNVPVLLPAGTVTEPGTTIWLKELLRLMTTPPGPAGVVKVTVPTAEFPLMTGFGAIAIDRNVVGLIVSVVDWLVLL